MDIYQLDDLKWELIAHLRKEHDIIMGNDEARRLITAHDGDIEAATADCLDGQLPDTRHPSLTVWERNR